MIEAEVKLFCEGEEIESREFCDPFVAEDFFDHYPLDEMVDEVQLFEIDTFGDWDMVDCRTISPDC